jgi:hypothetical protein
LTITQAVCTSFKVELMTATHNFSSSSGHLFKIALFPTAATPSLSGSTTTYSSVSAGEVTGTGYTAGGKDLTNVTPTFGTTTAYTDFSPDVVWSTSTITAGGALIYNSTSSG